MIPGGNPGLAIDAGEIEAHIEELGRIGALPGGGIYRGLYTPVWQEAMELVRAWMMEAGLSVRSDAAGNLFGRVDGTASPRVVMSGSHIDTVRRGGKYDGALGIHAALAAVKALVSGYGPPKKAMEVMVTCEEEASRFRANFWGSRSICGMALPSEADSVVDWEGVTLASAMRGVGLDPARIAEASRDDIDAFVELHIEQGRVLESSGHSLGVVDVITGMAQLEVQVTGRQDHAGTTPMDLRLDPMVGAAEMIGRILEIAATTGRPAVATVGRIAASPGAVNIVPESVTFTVDTRHTVPGSRALLLQHIRQTVSEVSRRRGLGAPIEQLFDHEAVPMDSRVRETLEDAAREEMVDYLVMPSGAGHDSQIMANRFPAGMLFVPSKDGRSHSPAECTPIEQIVPGVRVLARALHRLAYS